MALPRLLTRPVAAPVRRVRTTFRARVSGDPSGMPDWVRAIADVGEGPGWFEPDGVVWRVHGDLSTLPGGVAALLGQAAHPLALRGVERHSNYRDDPWKRLAGTARWLVVSTFGSAALAEQEAARVREMHARVRGPGYSASDPDLLRWVHLVFTDAFLSAQQAVGADLAPRFGRQWPDTYVREWACTAEQLGATDLPFTASELHEAITELTPQLAPVPDGLRSFLLAPPGLSAAERAFYLTLARAGGRLLHPALAPRARVPGRDDRGARARAELAAMRTQLAALHLVLGRYSPSEEAARWRLDPSARPAWAVRES